MRGLKIDWYLVLILTMAGLASVLPAKSYWWNTALEPADTIVTLNAHIRAIAKRKGCVYLDYWSAMADETKAMKPGLSEDGVHPNAAGYAVMRPALEQAIARALR